MARNLKRDYLKKLAGIEANGYKVDLANYVYNPSYEHEYPNLRKKIGDNEYSSIQYFKHYDGTGEYSRVTFTTDGKEGWSICKNKTEVVLEKANRFSMKKLIEFANAM